MLARLEDGGKLAKSVSLALWVMRVTVHTTRKRTTFEIYYAQTPRTRIKNPIDVTPAQHCCRTRMMLLFAQKNDTGASKRHER